MAKKQDTRDLIDKLGINKSPGQLAASHELEGTPGKSVVHKQMCTPLSALHSGGSASTSFITRYVLH